MKRLQHGGLAVLLQTAGLNFQSVAADEEIGAEHTAADFVVVVAVVECLQPLVSIEPGLELDRGLTSG